MIPTPEEIESDPRTPPEFQEITRLAMYMPPEMAASMFTILAASFTARAFRVHGIIEPEPMISPRNMKPLWGSGE